jgi:hypothetical protein
METETHTVDSFGRPPRVIRNPSNVAEYRRAIEQAAGRALPVEDNFALLNRMFGSDLDAMQRRGILNRGFCPLCGVAAIDESYSRGSHYTTTKVFICKDCWERDNWQAQMRKSMANLDMSNPDHRAAMRGYRQVQVLLLVPKLIKWTIIAAVIYAAWRYFR